MLAIAPLSSNSMLRSKSLTIGVLPKFTATLVSLVLVLTSVKISETFSCFSLCSDDKSRSSSSNFSTVMPFLPLDPPLDPLPLPLLPRPCPLPWCAPYFRKGQIASNYCFRTQSKLRIQKHRKDKQKHIWITPFLAKNNCFIKTVSRSLPSWPS